MKLILVPYFLLISLPAIAATNANGDKVISALQSLSSISNSCASDPSVMEAKNLLIQSLNASPAPAPTPVKPAPAPARPKAETMEVPCYGTTTDMAWTVSHNCQDLENASGGQLARCAYDKGMKACVANNFKNCQPIGDATYGAWEPDPNSSSPGERCRVTMTFRFFR